MTLSTLEELLSLLGTTEVPELGPGPRDGVRPEEAVRRQVGKILGQGSISGQNQHLIEALLLLWHDHLEPAHVIAQNIEGSDGAFVHGIMHRREPDYGNAKYWFRRVGQHSAFPELANRVAALPAAAGNQAVLARLVKGKDWDAFAMVDTCEEAARPGSASGLSSFLRQAQKVETEVLLSYLVTRA